MKMRMKNLKEELGHLQTSIKGTMLLSCNIQVMTKLQLTKNEREVQDDWKNKKLDM